MSLMIAALGSVNAVLDATHDTVAHQSPALRELEKVFLVDLLLLLEL